MKGVRAVSLCHHWRDQLVALEKGIISLERQRSQFRPAGEIKPAPRYTTAAGVGDYEPPAEVHRPIATTSVGEPLTVTVKVRDSSGVKWVRLRFRSVNPHLD